MGKSQDLGVCFTVPDYQHSDLDFSIIEKSVKAIFNTNYTKLEKVYSNSSWTIIYVIQPPLLTNASSWRAFFENMKKLLELTRDYNSHFCNEPEALR